MTTVIVYFDNTQHMDVADAECGHTIEELREIVAPIAERYDVNSIYLFGSRSRNESRKGSDYDFFVVLGSTRNLIKICGLLRELEEALGERVDIVTDGAQLTEDFTREVLNEGKLVYES